MKRRHTLSKAWTISIAGGLSTSLIFLNDGNGGFINASPKLWMDRDNPAVDDNLAVMLDYDSDGDPDVLVASLAVTDR